MQDRAQFRKNMADELADPVNGVATATLHKDAREIVSYSHIDPGAAFTSDAVGGIELLVIDGSITTGGDDLDRNDWLRLPEGEPLAATAGPEGAKVWMKTGHLPFAQPPAV